MPLNANFHHVFLVNHTVTFHKLPPQGGIVICHVYRLVTLQLKIMTFTLTPLRKYKRVISVGNFALKFQVFSQKMAKKTLGDTFLSHPVELSCAVSCGSCITCSRVIPTVEISEMSVTQSVECPLTVKDTATVSGHLSTRNGTGAGSISLALRRVLSHTAWAEVIAPIITFLRLFEHF